MEVGSKITGLGFALYRRSQREIMGEVIKSNNGKEGKRLQTYHFSACYIVLKGRLRICTVIRF